MLKVMEALQVVPKMEAYCNAANCKAEGAGARTNIWGRVWLGPRGARARMLGWMRLGSRDSSARACTITMCNSL